MRRALAILIVLFFGLWPLTATLQASDDVNLPPCCRRHGAHHCAMAAIVARRQQGSAPVFSAPSTCPYYPGAAVLVAPVSALVASATPLPPLLVRSFQPTAFHTRVPSRPGRTHAGRGPPLAL